MSAPSREDLIPWSWAITPLASDNRQCPSPASLLGTFAGVNVAATVFGVILGSRKVSGKIIWVISCGTFGKEHVGSSQTYKFMWIFPFALNLGANALNAWMTVTAKGYEHSTMPRIWDLMLFYCTRPRIGWIPLAWLASQDADMERDGPWTSAGRQAAIAEAILQVIGVYYMGRTVHFGAIHGYFLVHHAEFKNGANLLEMIIGALLYLVYILYSAGALFVSGFRFFFYLLEPGEEIEGFPRSNEACLVLTGGFTWICSWLFITGYVRLAGDL